MELAQLEMFAAVARAKSYSEAARQLYISHSTLSRAVSALEDELGVKLLVRGNRVEELTPAGSVLLEESERLLAQATATIERVQAVGKDEVEKN